MSASAAPPPDPATIADSAGLMTQRAPRGGRGALQEAIQPEGQTEFSGFFEQLASLCGRIAPVPVVVKEVGFGMSPGDVELLVQAGVAAVDVAGSGGTNWALVEGERDPVAASAAGLGTEHLQEATR